VYVSLAVHRQINLSGSVFRRKCDIVGQICRNWSSASSWSLPCSGQDQLLVSSLWATVTDLRRRLLTKLKTADAISMMALPSIHRSVQKRLVFPSPTAMRMDAKNMSYSLVLNCRSNPIHGLVASVRSTEHLAKHKFRSHIVKVKLSIKKLGVAIPNLEYDFIAK
jgi:hypothetical protein